MTDSRGYGVCWLSIDARAPTAVGLHHSEMNDTPVALDLPENDGLTHSLAHQELPALRAETAPMGQQVNGFENAGLPRPVRAFEHIDARTGGDTRFADVAPVLQAQFNQFHAGLT
jgi:hypothetical protein